MPVQTASSPTPADDELLAGVGRKPSVDPFATGRRTSRPLRLGDDTPVADYGPLWYLLRPDAGTWTDEQRCALPPPPRPQSAATAAQQNRKAAVRAYLGNSLSYDDMRQVIEQTQFAYPDAA
jgi:hypothetical protein